MTYVRASLLLAALTIGASTSLMQGCLVPDYCIFLYKPGLDWCRTVEGALMWPAGQPDLAEPIKTPENGDPTGCRCMNIIEEEIMMSMAPENEYIEISGELAIEARKQCAALVPDGFEHNCMTLDGPQASTVAIPFSGSESNECFGECAYTNPPPFKDCPDPDPYECNEQVSPGEDDVGTEDGTTEDGGAVIVTDLPRAP